MPQGSYEGLRAWGIGQLVKLGAAGAKGKDKEKAGGSSKGKEGKVASLTVRRFWRPEDISKEQAYKASSYHEVRGTSRGLGGIGTEGLALGGRRGRGAAQALKDLPGSGNSAGPVAF